MGWFKHVLFIDNADGSCKCYYFRSRQNALKKKSNLEKKYQRQKRSYIHITMYDYPIPDFILQ